MNVLFVDDSSTMRMIVKRTLKSVGYDDLSIAEAADGSLALEAISKKQSDLILCDWNMPVMNSLMLLKKLRADGNEVIFGFATTESTEAMRG